MDNRVSSLEKLTSEHGAKLPELKCNIGHIKDNMPDMKQIKDILECMMTKKKKPSTSRYPKVAILLSPWNSSWQIQNQNLPSILPQGLIYILLLITALYNYWFPLFALPPIINRQGLFGQLRHWSNTLQLLFVFTVAVQLLSPPSCCHRPPSTPTFVFSAFLDRDLGFQLHFQNSGGTQLVLSREVYGS